MEQTPSQGGAALRPGKSPHARLTDQGLEMAIGRMLQFGVLLAALVVFAGGLLYLAHDHARNGASRPDYTHFHGIDADLRTPAGIVSRAAHGDAEGLIQFGLLLLIATPIVRVIVAAGGFFLERDRLYVAISLLVLVILLWSLWHAR
ncbi:DUF1634 domain-containing protein [Silvibacterium dinghuense]|uniref:DUF1634 domain-containing protein n=1 Tax=Silvibacterium dinghuense TaxID=1560006 RepID=A0A4Q1SIG7_9BACT|nr:DUF1634 domain-containing protein [Silvibacterium dinghuense]RXS97195.1 DUF1634 domain-containing protein [Silvibacterium dinghuense]GGG96999.1 membrane protein [Silvibacterium dinghuense]